VDYMSGHMWTICLGTCVHLTPLGWYLLGHFWP